jgi:hypothetical protein
LHTLASAVSITLAEKASASYIEAVDLKRRLGLQQEQLGRARRELAASASKEAALSSQVALLRGALKGPANVSAKASSNTAASRMSGGVTREAALERELLSVLQENNTLRRESGQERDPLVGTARFSAAGESGAPRVRVHRSGSVTVTGGGEASLSGQAYEGRVSEAATVHMPSAGSAVSPALERLRQRKAAVESTFAKLRAKSED